MPILGTQASGYFEPPVYSLSQTFNASGNYTVPAGKTRLAVVGVGSGGGGGDGGSLGGAGGSGGGGAVTIIEEITTNAGTNYVVTIPSGGNATNPAGTASFGSVVTFNGGGGGNSGYVYYSNIYETNVGAGGTDGNNGSVSYNAGTQIAYSTNGGTINSSNNQISSFTGGGRGLASSRIGGGGAGGAGAVQDVNNNDWGSPGGGGQGSAGRILVYVK